MEEKLQVVTRKVIKTSACSIIPIPAYASKSRLVVSYKNRYASETAKQYDLTVLSIEAERLKSVFRYCIEVDLLPYFYSFLGDGKAPGQGHGDGTSRGLNTVGDENIIKDFAKLEYYATLFWISHKDTPRLINTGWTRTNLGVV